jgi:hypothetical protein
MPMRRLVLAVVLAAMAGLSFAAEDKPPPKDRGTHDCEREKNEQQTS